MRTSRTFGDIQELNNKDEFNKGAGSVRTYPRHIAVNTIHKTKCQGLIRTNKVTTRRRSTYVVSLRKSCAH